jgi:hypothetical protein
VFVHIPVFSTVFGSYPFVLSVLLHELGAVSFLDIEFWSISFSLRMVAKNILFDGASSRHE